MAISESQKKALKKYHDKTYFRMSFVMRKEYQPIFDYWFSKSGLSKNGFLNEAVKTYIGMLEEKEKSHIGK